MLRIFKYYCLPRHVHHQGTPPPSPTQLLSSPTLPCYSPPLPSTSHHATTFFTLICTRSPCFGYFGLFGLCLRTLRHSI